MQKAFHLRAVHDAIDEPMVQQIFRCLEIIRQLLFDRLLDDAPSCKPDQRSRLGHIDVANHGVAGGNAAGGRVRQHRDVRDAGALESGDVIWVPYKAERSAWATFRDVLTTAAQVATVYLVVHQATK